MEEYQVKVYPDRTEWLQNGQLHRVNGPAIECANGSKIWYQNDKRHRLDGPAIEYFNGTKKWYQNGKSHRVDGPAIEYYDGSREYWIEGDYLTEEEFIKRTQTKEVTMAELEQLLGYPVKIKK